MYTINWYFKHQIFKWQTKQYDATVILPACMHKVLVLYVIQSEKSGPQNSQEFLLWTFLHFKLYVQYLDSQNKASLTEQVFC